MGMDIATLSQLVISGLTIGCVYSLVGLGFALTLRATELINFAQGEMVMLGAFFGFTVTTTFKLPFVVAFLVAILLTGLFGVFMERFMLRPILDNKSPLLNLLIATLGISISLQAVAIILWGREPIAYPPVFREEPIILFGIRLQELNLWILGLGIGVMAALQFFFQKTLTGISWRAASLDPSTAALYGVNRRTNVALTFGLSAALGGAAGVLIAPLFFASYGLGHSVLVKAFASAAIGGFGIVGTMIGGLVLGVIETLAAGIISSEYKNVIMFGLLLAILMFFFRPRQPSGRSITEGSKIVAGREVRIFSEMRAGWTKPTVISGGLILWLLIPWLGGTYALRILNMAIIYGVAVLGLQIIVGYTGQFSFGHAAFFGIGAYASTLLAVKFGLPFYLSMPLGAGAAALAGWIVAPILRLSGHFLAIGTLAMGEIVFLLMINWKWLTNGAYGLYGIPFPRLGPLQLDTDEKYFILASVVLAVTYFFIRRLIRSRFGRALGAVRENELASLVSGVDAYAHKVKAFVVGTSCAGLGGALYAHYISYINPESFTFMVSVEMVTMVVIGGLGSLPGGIIGALVVILLPEYLRFLQDYRMVVYGVLIIAFMMFLPGGLADVARKPGRWLGLRFDGPSGVPGANNVAAQG
jgi:branched-chain amino acid transport system permease protein